MRTSLEMPPVNLGGFSGPVKTSSLPQRGTAATARTRGGRRLTNPSAIALCKTVKYRRLCTLLINHHHLRLMAIAKFVSHKKRTWESFCLQASAIKCMSGDLYCEFGRVTKLRFFQLLAQSRGLFHSLSSHFGPSKASLTVSTTVFTPPIRRRRLHFLEGDEIRGLR